MYPPNAPSPPQPPQYNPGYPPQAPAGYPYPQQYGQPGAPVQPPVAPVGPPPAKGTVAGFFSPPADGDVTPDCALVGGAVDHELESWSATAYRAPSRVTSPTRMSVSRPTTRPRPSPRRAS